VLAFSLPFLPNLINQPSSGAGGSAVSIYIDNSFSMQAQSDQLNLLEEAKRKAMDIAGAYNHTASIQLLSNEFSGTQQHFLDPAQIQNNIAALSTTPEFRSLAAVFNRQKDLLNASDAKEKTVFLLSDFQKTNLLPADWENDSNVNVYFVPITTNEQANLLIDSCWFESPIRKINEQEVIHVRIRNLSDRDYENLPVKLYLNGKQKTPVTTNIKANSSVTLELTYTTRTYGPQEGVIVVRDHPIVFDDSFYFNYTLDSTVSVLVINGETQSSALKALFSDDPNFKLTSQAAAAIDFGTLDQHGLLILNRITSPSSGLIQALKQFLATKGDVVIFPPLQPDKVAYEELCTALNLPQLSRLDTNQTTVAQFNKNATLFENVFREVPANLNLPEVFKHYKLASGQRKNAEWLLTLNNGDPFLQRIPYRSGNIYLFTSPLDNATNRFGTHSLVVPTLYNMALLSNRPAPLFYTIGKNTSVTLPRSGNGEVIYHLKQEGFDAIPEVRKQDGVHLLHFHQQIKKAGNYTLYNDREERKAGLAFNYDRKESELTTYSNEELQHLITANGWKNVSLMEANSKRFEALLRFGEEGQALWKYCLILAVLFLLIEMSLTKLWK
jgi:hypothetical protein